MQKKTFVVSDPQSNLNEIRRTIIKFSSHSTLINPFVPNALFLYPLKTENRKDFQKVEEWCIGNEWVKINVLVRDAFRTQSNAHCPILGLLRKQLTA